MPTAALQARPDVAALSPTGAAASGSFRSPSVRHGTFAGCYRLLSCRWVDGRLVTVGVVTGALTDADGTRIGIATRRVRTDAAPVDCEGSGLVQIGPLSVDLLDLEVHLDPLIVDVAHGCDEPAVRAALWLLDSSQEAGGRPPTLRTLSEAVAAPGSQAPPGPMRHARASATAGAHVEPADPPLHDHTAAPEQSPPEQTWETA